MVEGSSGVEERIRQRLFESSGGCKGEESDCKGFTGGLINIVACAEGHGVEVSADSREAPP
jgi:hypothetical protein